MSDYTLDLNSTGADGSTTVSSSTGDGTVGVTVSTPKSDGHSFKMSGGELESSCVDKPTTAEFTFTEEVSNVTFEVFDVDSGRGWDDKVTIVALNAAGEEVEVTFSNLYKHEVNGNSIEGDGNDTSAVEGSGALDTVTVTIPGPIVSFSVIHDNGSDSSTSGTVKIADISFDEASNLDGIVSGTDGDDTITVDYEGDPDGDMIDNDDALLDGEVGDDDIVHAGAGDDLVISGDGDDEVFGESGDDTLCGVDGDDELHGGTGDDFLEGMNDNDLLFGEIGDDTVAGDAGDDVAYGGAGADTITGGSGDDELYGGALAKDVTLDFNDLTTGEVVGNQFISDGVTISSASASNPVMVFDTANPTGGDSDLASSTLGNVLILSEDGDSTDPDDDASGGTFVFDFADVSTVNSLTFLDMDNGVGTVTLFDVDGAVIATIPTPTTANGGVATLDIDTAGVASMTVSLPGSGAIDNLSYSVDADAGDEADYIDGGSGDDYINGNAGDDTLLGGAGNDTIIDTSGSETVEGGSGDDFIDVSGANSGPNTFDELAADPSLLLDAALDDTPYPTDIYDDANPTDDIDYVDGGAGNDTIYTGDDADTVLGGDGDDTIYSGIDNDTVYGGSGNDTIIDVQGADYVDGGDGDDYIDVGNDTFSDYVGDDPALPNALYPYGSDQNTEDGKDTVYGGAGNDTILTGDDADYIDGGSGDDTINAGIDDDVVYGGTGNDTIIGGHGSDEIYGGDGDDYIDASDVDGVMNHTDESDDTDPAPENDRDYVDGGAGDDTIIGGDDTDTLLGGDGDDTIDGGIDNDMLYGNAGNDTIDGGDGDDLIVGDDSDLSENLLVNGALESGQADGTFSQVSSITGWQSNSGLIETWGNGFEGEFSKDGGTFIELDAERGLDSIYQDVDTTDGESYTISVDVMQRVEGSEDQVEVYFGGVLIDTIEPGDEWETYEFEVTGSGDDRLEFRELSDENSTYGPLLDNISLTSNDGSDILNGGAGDDTIYGNRGDDIIDGGDGNDTITGGTGADEIFGGADADTIIGGNAGDVVDGGEAGDDNDTLDLTGAGPLNIIYDPSNSENGTVDFLDGEGNVTGSMTFENIENVIPCFTPGTMIATPKGEVAVETLKVGDKVITRDNGLQTIRWVGHKTLSSVDLMLRTELCPVMIRKGALGNDLPERDMMVSPNHRMLVASEKAALYFDDHEVLVAAKHLTKMDGVELMGAEGVTYVHVMFDHHEVILGNGTWSESFQPGDFTLAGIGEEQREEIFSIFPELREKSGRGHYETARRVLRKHEAELLVS
ncbi:Hint domain-containing protein [Pacificibacter marinus]|uniref:Hint domain-containing protein n=1 Tax=Pacificibacter marinus TaxID=658057 RepID=UPI001C066468|nr:Hint domain-containing protein [Pacificibacter marinus]MBU2866289.1 Hint domain-containing protein [Pacificibacter marinus]